MPKKSKSIIVTVTDDALKNIHKLADTLASKGMTVERVLPMTGVISGSCLSTKLSTLAQVDGVNSVEEEVAAELPPLDSSVQ